LPVLILTITAEITPFTTIVPDLFHQVKKRNYGDNNIEDSSASLFFDTAAYGAIKTENNKI
jgi:hypothetical protein